MLKQFAVLVLIGAAAGSAFGQETKRLDIARALVSEMAAGQFEKAIEPFDPIMKHALPADKLKEVWDGLTKQYGPFQRATAATTEKVQQYEVVYVTCEFQKGTLDAKVVFTQKNEVTGLFFIPSGRYKSPSYADASKFEEKEISIGKGIWRLPGTLSLPNGSGPFPCVILVHGSGPHDRDETIGPNKPFRDLAYGLATRGIAVLRYEKRTKEYPTLTTLSINTITVKEETIDDAAAAVEALTTDRKIGPIFLLGHSLGGMLIPRIAKANPKIAGFISLAGSTRPLEDLALEQTKYILSMAGKPTEKELKKLKEIERELANVKLLKPSDTTLVLGAPAKYWLDLRGYDPAQSAKELSKPMLIFAGGEGLSGHDGGFRRLEECTWITEGRDFHFLIPSSITSSWKVKARAPLRSMRSSAMWPRLLSKTLRNGSRACEAEPIMCQNRRRSPPRFSSVPELPALGSR